jgi:hypothetical protein
MTVDAILSELHGAAPAAAAARVETRLWWRDFPSAAARLHRW